VRSSRELESGLESKALRFRFQQKDMAPLPGVLQIKGDITDLRTADLIVSHFKGQRADLVVSDGAPDVTGLHDIDEYLQSQLILAALNIVTHVIREGGTFVAKIFRSKDTTLLYSQLKLFFPTVTVAKPKSSRNSSLESFMVCQNYTLPPQYVPSMIDPMTIKYSFPVKDADANNASENANHILIPFIACGDLSGYDVDQTSSLNVANIFHAPVEPLINPPHSPLASANND